MDGIQYARGKYSYCIEYYLYHFKYLLIVLKDGKFMKARGVICGVVERIRQNLLMGFGYVERKGRNKSIDNINERHVEV